MTRSWRVWRHGQVLNLIIVLLAAVLGHPVVASNMTPLQLAPRSEIHDLDFRVTEFASELFFPYGMATLKDGSLLVGTSRPRTSTNGFFASQGELIRLVDANSDGVADGPGTIVAAQLPGTLIDVRVVDQLICLVSAEFGNEQIDFMRLGPGPQYTASPLGQIRIQFPWVHHQTYGLLVRPHTNQAHHYDVFFNVGSLFNRQISFPLIPTSGLIATNLQGESIYRLRLEDHGDSVSVLDLVQVASGVRNAAGMTFDPVTGDFLFADNGIDGEGNSGAVSADELDRLLASQLDGAPRDFGYPDNYVDAAAGTIVGGAGEPPLISFLALPDQGESEGPAQITWAPPGFPAELNRGVFVGFHGKYDVTGGDNDENALIYAEPSTGKYFHLIRAGSAGIGHLDGLMATQDSLFVADLTGVGSLQTNNATGKIYQIQAVNRRIGCAGGPPQLLVSVQPNTKSIVLTWSALAVPCELQQSSSLGTQNVWSRIENPPQRQNDLYSREFEVSESPTFYRLHCPECDPSATSATSSASRRTLQF